MGEKEREDGGTELFYMEPFTLGGTLCTPSSTLQPRGLFSTKKSPCSDTRTVMLASCAKFSALLNLGTGRIIVITTCLLEFHYFNGRYCTITKKAEKKLFSS